MLCKPGFAEAASFTFSSQSGGPNMTTDVVFADLNGDGYPDYVSADTSMQVFLNDGAGGFPVSPSTTVGGTVGALGVADMDGDGDLDLVHGSQIIATPSQHVTISWYENDGAANFSLATSYDILLTHPSPQTGVNNLVPFDADADGDTDLLVMTYEAEGPDLFLNDGTGQLSAATGLSLPSYKASGFAVADFDSDGDLDFIVSDLTGLFDQHRFFRNEGEGTFTDAAEVDAGHWLGNLPVGDFDGDGDIDLLGGTVDNDVIKLLRNDGSGNFTVSGTIGAPGGGISWKHAIVDLDNDGTLDLLLKAADGYIFVCPEMLVCSQYVLVSQYSRTGIAAADIERDGDVDFVIVGPSGYNEHYVNDQAATIPNGDPTAVSAASTSVTVETASTTATVRLSWGSGSDAITPTRLLQYAIRVGTTPGGNDIVAGASVIPPWSAVLRPNGQSRTRLLRDLACGLSYYWSVGTIDTGHRTSWSAERSFTLNTGCQLPLESSGTPGGGFAYWLLSQKKSLLNGGTSADEMSDISVSAFLDITGDGIRSPREQLLLKPFTVSVSGATVQGQHFTVSQDFKGGDTLRVKVPLSSKDGYTIQLFSGSLAHGLHGTGPLVQTGVVISRGSGALITFALAPTELLRYRPCLAVGERKTTERDGTDAEIFLQRLENSFGERVAAEAIGSSGLTTRREFLSLLAKVHCLEADSNSKRYRNIPRLIDLTLQLGTSDSTLMWTLIRNRIPAVRKTLLGPAADLDSPISREEAILAVAAVVHPPIPNGIAETTPLPHDLSIDDPFATTFAALKSIGVSSSGLEKTFGKSQGLTAGESAELLARSALRSGVVELLPRLSEPRREFIGRKVDTFLSVLPKLPINPCLKIDASRASNVWFTDLPPGESLEHEINGLLQFFIERDGRAMWLLTGTTRTTEFGVTSGRSPLRLDEPVSLLELVRSALILNCLPPASVAESHGAVVRAAEAATAEQRVARDRVSNLARDASLASRLMYRAQDHIREFDLSLFTYAPELLRADVVRPSEPYSLDDAASFLSSSILNGAVKQGVMTPLNAENYVQVLRAAVLKDLIAYNPIQMSVSTAQVALTRRQLMHFLNVVTTQELEKVLIDPETLPLGQIWWDRLGN